MKLAAGLALVAAGCLVWGIDSRRGTNTEARADYVLANARAWLPEGGMPAASGEMVVAVGVPLPSEPLVDDVTGFSLEVLRLSRDVEIYQWRERITRHSSTDDNGNERVWRTYSYEKVWTDHPISSVHFEKSFTHRNRGSLPFPDRTLKASSIRFGDAVLDPAYASMMGGMSPFPVTREMFDGMPEELKSRFAIVDGRLFPDRSPEIGDIRVTYQALMPRQATIVGEYRDGAIVPAKTEAGEISFFRWGNLDVEKVVEMERSDSRTLGIFLKILAGLLALGGCTLAALGLREGGHLRKSTPLAR